MNPSILQQFRAEFHQTLCQSILTVNDAGVPSIADKNNRFSVAVSKGIVERLGGHADRVAKAAGQTAGNSFESMTMHSTSSFTCALANGPLFTSADAREVQSRVTSNTRTWTIWLVS